MDSDSRLPDAVFHEVEAQLQALRRLIAPMTDLNRTQSTAVQNLVKRLRDVELQAYSLRKSLETGTDPVSMEVLREERALAETAAIAELANIEARLRIENPSGFRRDFRNDEGYETGGSRVPVAPIRPVPVLAGGAARTFEESDAPPRNP